MNAKVLNIFSVVLLLLVATSWSVPVDTDAADAAADETTTQRSGDMDDGDNTHHGHSSQHELKLTEEQLKGAVVCTEHKNLSCSPEFKKEMAPCMDPKVYGTEEGLKNPNCMFFCQGHAVGIIDEHGMPTKDLYDHFIDLAFPEKQVAGAKETIHKCIDDLGSKVDPKDAQCEGAGEFNKCTFQAFAVECE